MCYTIKFFIVVENIDPLTFASVWTQHKVWQVFSVHWYQNPQSEPLSYIIVMVIFKKDSNSILSRLEINLTNSKIVVG